MSVWIVDVDGDGSVEVVFCDFDDFFVYDVMIGRFEKIFFGLGGQVFVFGQIDVDFVFEVVVVNGFGLGRVVDLIMGLIEWILFGGFGWIVEMEDLDGDGCFELIVGDVNQKLQVYDLGLCQLFWVDIGLGIWFFFYVVDVQGGVDLEIIVNGSCEIRIYD